MQLLPKGFIGKSYRSTENTVLNLFRGSCTIEVDGTKYELAEHDVFVVPSWKSYRFESAEDSFIFSFTDRAAQQTLGFWVEEYLS